MPKKKEEKNTKGIKKTTKTSTSKKNVNTKKVVKEPVVKNEVKEVTVVKEEKKGSCILNNTPLVVSICIIILLTAMLIWVLCTKRIPVTSNGDEIVASIDGKTITANDLYSSLKEAGGKEQLLNIIDEYIADKEVTVTKADEEYVQEVVDYYIDYAEYYETDLATFLKDYVGLNGISTEKEFAEFVLKDYKKTLAVQNYIIEKAEEKDIKAYYEENYSDKLTVKHILIEVDSEAEDKDKADKEAYDKAVKLIQKLNKADEKELDETFEELAKNNSDDTGTYADGGLIKDFTKADVLKEFYEASYELENGKYTAEPVKTSYGYHIILKVSSTEKEAYEDVVEEAKKGYAQAKLNEDDTLFATKWAELREAYKLSINDDFINDAYKKSIKTEE